MRNKNEWADIIRQNIHLLNGSNCEKLYSMLAPQDRNYLTRGILACGVNPMSKIFKEVPEAMYFNMSDIITVKIHSRIESIGQLAFANCKKLTTLTIPVGIKFIDDRAFFGCMKLTHIIYEGTMQQWSSASEKFFPTWSKDSVIEDIRCSDGTIPME